MAEPAERYPDMAELTEQLRELAKIGTKPKLNRLPAYPMYPRSGLNNWLQLLKKAWHQLTMK